MKIEKTSDFSNMVIRNTINDFYTPNIKAEVILDMLLTDYVPLLLESKVHNKVRMITKEMSIGYAKEENENSNRGKKVDYVACDEKYIYLIELKTTQGSLGKNQKKIYLTLQSQKAKILLEQLCRIVELSGELSPYDELAAYLQRTLTNEKKGVCNQESYKKAIRENTLIHLTHQYQKKNNVASTKKYLHTIACILQNSSKEDWEKEMKIVYISPEGVLEPDIIDISFSDMEKDTTESLKEFKESILYQEIIRSLYAQEDIKV